MFPLAATQRHADVENSYVTSTLPAGQLETPPPPPVVCCYRVTAEPLGFNRNLDQSGISLWYAFIFFLSFPGFSTESQMITSGVGEFMRKAASFRLDFTF